MIKMVDHCGDNGDDIWAMFLSDDYLMMCYL